jgi:hypothetical protein
MIHEKHGSQLEVTATRSLLDFARQEVLGMPVAANATSTLEPETVRQMHRCWPNWLHRGWEEPRIASEDET